MSTQRKKNKHGLGLTKKLFMLLLFLLFGYLGSLAIEYTGIVIGAWDVDHTQQMLLKEVGYFKTSNQNQIPGIPTPSQTILSFLYFVNTTGLSFSDVYQFMKASEFSDTAAHIAAIPFGVFSLYGVRLIVCIYSLLMFLVFIAIALQEGFLSRHLRKLGGGEESSFKYHILKRNVKPVFFTAWSIYLLSPFSYHPNNILVPLGIAFAFLLWATTANWKKIT